MDIILPVAGLGTRLRPQTWSKPKPLVSIAGKPILAHVIDRVLPVQPEKLVFITGFLGDQIEAWARATYTLPMEFVEQPEMLGQTDAIIRTREIVHEDALVLFPDMIFEADFSNLAAVDGDGVMFTKEVEDPSSLGIAVVENDRIVKLIEKPKEPISNLAVIGIYYFKCMSQLFAAIDEQMAQKIKLKNEYFIADAVQLMIDGGAKVVTAPVTVWEDCGNVEALLATNKFLLDLQGSITELRGNSVIVGPSAIASDAVLERSIVGPYASIGAGVEIRDSLLRNAIVEEGASIEQAILEQTLIGRGTRVRGRASNLNVGDNSAVDL
ncbi:MAG: sugar phosphate nucleotidyltransferase [Thermomicrobiales bacterium]